MSTGCVTGPLASLGMSPAEAVRAFFERMQAREWAGAGETLADDVEVWWPHTRERFSGPNFLAVQEAYPEGWEITVVDVQEAGPKVAARVIVTLEGQTYHCVAFYDLVEGRISRGVEYWVTEGAEEAPRLARAVPGLTRCQQRAAAT
jgi:ketosteroid isomerase-like protein